MADKKISALTELVGAPADADSFVVVDDSASETKRISAANLISKDHTHTLSDITDYGTEIGVNNQVGTSYTLVLGDQDAIVRMNNSSPNTVTVPPESSVDFPVGAVVMVSQVGTGTTSIAAGSGVTLNAAATSLTEQWASASLVKVAADTWDLYGNVN